MAQLNRELLSARGAEKAALEAANDQMLAMARARIADAEIALGLRGKPWQEASDDTPLRIRLGAMIRALLRSRDAGKTICPSEAARATGGEKWRDILPTTVETAWALEHEKWLEVTQSGRTVARPTKGAIRLRRIGE